RLLDLRPRFLDLGVLHFVLVVCQVRRLYAARSRIHCASSFTDSTVSRGARSSCFMAFRPDQTRKPPVAATTAPTSSADPHQGMPASARRMMIAARIASNPAYA